MFKAFMMEKTTRARAFKGIIQKSENRATRLGMPLNRVLKPKF